MRSLVVFPDRPQDVLESALETTAFNLEQLPAADPTLLEIAFAGRSNVGKSSLINALINRKGLARTSNTPGKTRSINIYRCRVRGPVILRTEDSGSQSMGSPSDAHSGNKNQEAVIRLVDLPGYGYAQVSHAERRAWEPLVETYLTSRTTLWGVSLVIDGRRTPEASDQEMADWLGHAGIPYLAALTKTDRTSQKERARALRGSEGLLRSLGARDVLPVSAVKNTNIVRLWTALGDLRI